MFSLESSLRGSVANEFQCVCFRYFYDIFQMPKKFMRDCPNFSDQANLFFVPPTPDKNQIKNALKSEKSSFQDNMIQVLNLSTPIDPQYFQIFDIAIDTSKFSEQNLKFIFSSSLRIFIKFTIQLNHIIDTHQPSGCSFFSSLHSLIYFFSRFKDNFFKDFHIVLDEFFIQLSFRSSAIFSVSSNPLRKDILTLIVSIVSLVKEEFNLFKKSSSLFFITDQFTKVFGFLKEIGLDHATADSIRAVFHTLNTMLETIKDDKDEVNNLINIVVLILDSISRSSNDLKPNESFQVVHVLFKFYAQMTNYIFPELIHFVKIVLFIPWLITTFPDDSSHNVTPPPIEKKTNLGPINANEYKRLTSYVSDPGSLIVDSHLEQISGFILVIIKNSQTSKILELLLDSLQKNKDFTEEQYRLYLAFLFNILKQSPEKKLAKALNDRWTMFFSPEVIPPNVLTISSTSNNYDYRLWSSILFILYKCFMVKPKRRSCLLQNISNFICENGYEAISLFRPLLNSLLLSKAEDIWNTVASSSLICQIVDSSKTDLNDFDYIRHFIIMHPDITFRYKVFLEMLNSIVNDPERHDSVIKCYEEGINLVKECCDHNSPKLKGYIIALNNIFDEMTDLILSLVKNRNPKVIDLVKLLVQYSNDFPKETYSHLSQLSLMNAIAQIAYEFHDISTFITIIQLFTRFASSNSSILNILVNESKEFYMILKKALYFCYNPDAKLDNSISELLQNQIITESTEISESEEAVIQSLLQFCICEKSSEDQNDNLNLIHQINNYKAMELFFSYYLIPQLSYGAREKILGIFVQLADSSTSNIFQMNCAHLSNFLFNISFLKIDLKQLAKTIELYRLLISRGLTREIFSDTIKIFRNNNLNISIQIFYMFHEMIQNQDQVFIPSYFHFNNNNTGITIPEISLNSSLTFLFSIRFDKYQLLFPELFFTITCQERQIFFTIFKNKVFISYLLHSSNSNSSDVEPKLLDQRSFAIKNLSFMKYIQNFANNNNKEKNIFSYIIPQDITLRNWNSFAFVFEGNALNVYIDGKQCNPTESPEGIIFETHKTLNLFPGKSAICFAGQDSNFTGDFSKISILNSSEIKLEKSPQFYSYQPNSVQYIFSPNYTFGNYVTCYSDIHEIHKKSLISNSFCGIAVREEGTLMEILGSGNTLINLILLFSKFRNSINSNEEEHTNENFAAIHDILLGYTEMDEFDKYDNLIKDIPMSVQNGINYFSTLIRLIILILNNSSKQELSSINFSALFSYYIRNISPKYFPLDFWERILDIFDAIKDTEECVSFIKEIWINFDFLSFLPFEQQLSFFKGKGIWEDSYKIGKKGYIKLNQKDIELFFYNVANYKTTKLRKSSWKFLFRVLADRISPTIFKMIFVYLSESQDKEIILSILSFFHSIRFNIQKSSISNSKQSFDLFQMIEPIILKKLSNPDPEIQFHLIEVLFDLAPPNVNKESLVLSSILSINQETNDPRALPTLLMCIFFQDGSTQLVHPYLIPLFTHSIFKVENKHEAIQIIMNILNPSISEASMNNIISLPFWYYYIFEIITVADPSLTQISKFVQSCCMLIEQSIRQDQDILYIFPFLDLLSQNHLDFHSTNKTTEPISNESFLATDTQLVHCEIDETYDNYRKLKLQIIHHLLSCKNFSNDQFASIFKLIFTFLFFQTTQIHDLPQMQRSDNKQVSFVPRSGSLPLLHSNESSSTQSHQRKLSNGKDSSTSLTDLFIQEINLSEAPAFDVSTIFPWFKPPDFVQSLSINPIVNTKEGAEIIQSLFDFSQPYLDVQISIGEANYPALVYISYALLRLSQFSENTTSALLLSHIALDACDSLLPIFSPPNNPTISDQDDQYLIASLIKYYISQIKKTDENDDEIDMELSRIDRILSVYNEIDDSPELQLFNLECLMNHYFDLWNSFINDFYLHLSRIQSEMKSATFNYGLEYDSFIKNQSIIQKNHIISTKKIALRVFQELQSGFGPWSNAEFFEKQPLVFSNHIGRKGSHLLFYQPYEIDFPLCEIDFVSNNRNEILFNIPAELITINNTTEGSLMLSLSSFIFHLDSKSIIEYPASEIAFVFIRQNHKFEVYMLNSNAYLFRIDPQHISLISKSFNTVLSKNDLKLSSEKFDFFSALKSLKDINIPKKEIIAQLHLAEKWQEHEISTYEYLIYLNLIGGRSFNDKLNYPVFPWIFSDYESIFIDVKNPKNSTTKHRDLKKPIGAINQERLDRLKSEDKPFLYEKIYSTEYSFGWLDNISNMQTEWNRVMKDHNCYEELLPEFFCSQNFLKPNFILPKWAKSAHHFIQTHKMALENAPNISRWIDLIFGCSRNSSELNNTYNNLFYPENTSNEAEEFQNIYGSCALQLFDTPHAPRPFMEETGNEIQFSSHFDFHVTKIEKIFVQTSDGSIYSLKTGKNLMSTKSKLLCVSTSLCIAIFGLSSPQIPGFSSITITKFFVNDEIPNEGEGNSKNSISWPLPINGSNALCATIIHDTILAIGFDNNTIKIWQLYAEQPPKLLETFRYHQSPVTYICGCYEIGIICSNDYDNKIVVQTILPYSKGGLGRISIIDLKSYIGNYGCCFGIKIMKCGVLVVAINNYQNNIVKILFFSLNGKLIQEASEKGFGLSIKRVSYEFEEYLLIQLQENVCIYSINQLKREKLVKIPENSTISPISHSKSIIYSKDKDLIKITF